MNKTHKLEIIPGILESSWSEIEKKVEAILPFAKTIHIDIVDGKFSPSTTFLDPNPFKKYTSEALFELHMMVEQPLQYLKPWAEAGFKRFIGQVEKMSDQIEFIAQGQLLGEVGLALDGPTPIEQIAVPLNDLDCILIYAGDNLGQSGGTMQPDKLQKVSELAINFEGPIEVDGGGNNQTIKQAKDAGASRFVTTRFLFSSTTPHDGYNNLKLVLGENPS